MPATSVAVLGSTGSIGTQTLDLVADRPDEFDVVAIGAARSVGMLIEQASRFRPEVVAITDAAGNTVNSTAAISLSLTAGAGTTGATGTGGGGTGAGNWGARAYPKPA